MNSKQLMKVLMGTVVVTLLLGLCGATAGIFLFQARASEVRAAAVERTAPLVETPAERAEQVPEVAPAPEHSAPEIEIGLPGAITSLEDQLTGLYEAVSPSVVHIRTGGGEGSGFVWDERGHIVTNNHVIAGARQIVVGFSDGTVVPAELVGTDPASDLAVLRVEPAAVTLQPVVMGDSTALAVGELAIAIGSPFGQTGTMTVGFVSALGRLQPAGSDQFSGGQFSIADMIQTDAAINPGNSGGVLLDENGVVMGVTSSIISPVRGSAGIGFAIPSALVQRVVPALIDHGAYQHPYLGISGATLDPDTAPSLGLPTTTRGALVLEVVPGGPADSAGLRAGQVGGDVIVAVDGIAVGGMDELITQLSRRGVVGESVELTVLRDGQSVALTVTVGARPS